MRNACATEIAWGKFRVIMMVADELATIWRQDICNHHDDVGRSVRLRSPPT